MQAPQRRGELFDSALLVELSRVPGRAFNVLCDIDLAVDKKNRGGKSGLRRRDLHFRFRAPVIVGSAAGFIVDLEDRLATVFFEQPCMVAQAAGKFGPGGALPVRQLADYRLGRPRRRHARCSRMDLLQRDKAEWNHDHVYDEQQRCELQVTYPVNEDRCHINTQPVPPVLKHFARDQERCPYG